MLESMPPSPPYRPDDWRGFAALRARHEAAEPYKDEGWSE